jgi:hypothetical protein
VHLQDRYWVASYNKFHENSNLCTFVVGKGARTSPRRAALKGRFHLASMPDAPGEFEGRGGSQDRLEPRMRPANGSKRYPRLRREGSGCAPRQIFAPRKNPRRLRREECRSLAPDAPPLAEGVRARHESVDFGDGRRGCLRGGAYTEAGLRGDHPGDLVAPAWSEVDAGEAMDHLSRPSVRKKKGGATD